jgi:uncharacterized protein
VSAVLPLCAIVDGHHHLGFKPGLGEFSGEDVVRKMDRDGVAKSVVMSFVSPLRTQEDFDRANDYVAKEVERHSGRLFGAVAVDPRSGSQAIEQIERYHQAGFRAVKLHPRLHGDYAVDGGVVDEVAAVSGTLGLPIVIHCDTTREACSPRAIAALALRFPETMFVALHLGLHPEAIKDTPAAVRDTPNVLVDTSQTPDFPHDVYVEPVRVLGAERVLFGSDGPECDLSLNLRKLALAIEQYGLSDHDAALVLGGNAERVFGI